MRRLSLAACVAAIACLPLAVSLAAYREGPLPAMTGGFGEPSCRSCHFDKPLNDPAGSLAISGIPAQYQAGQKYQVTVTIKRAVLRVAGFEMTSRIADGPRAGQQAGDWQGPPDRTHIVFAPGQPIQYIQHTKAGSSVPAGASAGTWTVQWTAPAKGSESVVFHVAANASNDDQSPLGDFIYTTTIKTRGRGSSVENSGDIPSARIPGVSHR
jgi:hypothetical protein